MSTPYALPYIRGYIPTSSSIPNLDSTNLNAVNINTTSINATTIQVPGSVSLGAETFVTSAPSTLPFSRSLTPSADVTLSDAGPSSTLTLGLSNVGTAGTTNIPSSITTDAKGRVTAVGATAADLSAIEAQAGTGILTRTAADTWTTRTLQSANATISVTNGNGAAGNPVVDFLGLPVLRTTKDGTQSLAHTTTDTAAAATAVTAWRTDTEFDNVGVSGFNTTSGEWTVPQTAVYSITFKVQIATSNADANNIIRGYIRRNSPSVTVLSADLRGAPNTQNASGTTTFVGRLTLNDVIEFRASHENTSAAARDVASGDTWLSIVRLFNS